MNRMLINAIHKDEELRIAMASGQSLYDLTIESQKANNKKSNVYKGVITRVEPSLEAAFVDYGAGRHGFLPLKEIARTCFRASFHDSGRRPTINEVVEEGQELIVQVEKEERGNKGAALTTFITLPGCYLVLMPNNPRAGGVSRRIEGDERDEIHSVLNELTVPEGMGLIIRTAGGGRSIEELQWDLDILLRLWGVIQHASEQQPAPFLIYQEGNAVIRALRDYLRKDIDEILIDHTDVYEEVIKHLQLIRPDFVSRVKHYKDPTPLFTRFQIESQIESAFQREVRLPSGGSIIIDHTEALVSVDINSAKSTKGGDIEETALMTNLEAADEIARQLRLRDIGGLIVIDFIDMTPLRNQREVEERLKRALSMDRARVQVGRISRFGILEMSRQRLRTSLGETSRVTCPRCLGQGTIRGIESLGLSIVRIIEEEAMKDNTAQVRAILPTEIAAYLLNEKRQAIIDIEKRQHVSIIVVPSAHFLTPQYEVERVRLSDITEKDEKLASYKLALKPEVSSQTQTMASQKAQEPAVKSIPLQETPAPAPNLMAGMSTRKNDEPGLLKRIFAYLFEKKNTPQTAAPGYTYKTSTQRPAQNNRRNNKSNRSHTNRNRNNRRGNNNYRQQAQGNEQRERRQPRDAQPGTQDIAREVRENKPQQDRRDQPNTAPQDRVPSQKQANREIKQHQPAATHEAREISIQHHDHQSAQPVQQDNRQRHEERNRQRHERNHEQRSEQRNEQRKPALPVESAAIIPLPTEMKPTPKPTTGAAAKPAGAEAQSAPVTAALPTKVEARPVQAPRNEARSSTESHTPQANTTRHETAASLSPATHEAPKMTPIASSTPVTTSTTSHNTTSEVTQKLEGEANAQRAQQVDGQRKPRPRFKPHRHRRHAKRAAGTNGTSRALEGEDIYTNKEREN